MANIQVINEYPLTLVELKDKLVSIKKRDKELNDKGNKIKDYVDLFANLTSKKVAELKKKIMGLEISRLKDRHVAKIINIMPEEVDSLRTVFVGETVTIKPEDLKRIIGVVKEYV